MQFHPAIRWSGAVLLLAVAATAQSPRPARRLVVDPWTGTRWLLASNPAAPGGPGLLVPEAAVPAASGIPAGPAPLVAPPVLVIRAGDRLVVDASTPVVTAQLTAVALAPATVGSIFLARCTGGAHPVRLVALGPGQARLAPPVFAEAQP